MDADRSRAVLRSREDRPGWGRVLWRAAVVTIVTGVSLWLLAAIVPGFTIDSVGDALLAGFVIGVANAVVWPALAFVVVPLSVITLGVGAIVLDAVFVGLVLDALPGVEVDGFWAAFWVVTGLVVVSTVVDSLLAMDDTAWVDRGARSPRRQTGQPRGGVGRARLRVHPDRWAGPERPAPSDPLRRRTDVAPVAP